MNITKEEVVKIAQISHIALAPHELEQMTAHLGAVLGYAQRVNAIKAGSASASNLEHKNVNAMRADEVIRTNPQPILVQAPAQEENYFVVPRILEQ